MNKTILFFSAIVLFILVASNSYSTDFFRQPTTLLNASWPEALSIGDVNGDGKNDVVVTTSTLSYNDPLNDFKLFVFIQGQSGYLKSPIKFPLLEDSFAYAGSVEIGDINGDGRNDVIVGHTNKRIDIFYQKNNGQLEEISKKISTPYSSRLQITDMNNDNLQDIISLKSSDNKSFAIFYQNTNHRFDTPIYVNSGCDNIMHYDAKDVNDDNKIDLIYSCYSNSEYKVFIKYQLQEKSFSSSISYSTPYPNKPISSIAAGDFNNDSLNDIVISLMPDPFKIIVFTQSSQHEFNSFYIKETYYNPDNFIIIDVNADDQNDLLIFHGGCNKAGIYIQNDSFLKNEYLFDSPYTNYGYDRFDAGDINNDGLVDIVASDSLFGFYILYNINSTFDIQMPWLLLLYNNK